MRKPEERSGQGIAESEARTLADGETVIDRAHVAAQFERDERAGAGARPADATIGFGGRSLVGGAHARDRGMSGETTREFGGVGGEAAGDFLHAADLRGEDAEIERVQGLQATTRGGQHRGGVRPGGIDGEHAGHDITFGAGVFREARDDDVGERQDVDRSEADAAGIEEQLGSVLIAEGTERRQVGGLELRVVRDLREDAGDGARRQETLDRGEVAHVGDEVMLGVARLLEETRGVDIEPTELNPVSATAWTLHGLDGSETGVDRVHPGGGDEDVRRRHAGEIRGQRGADRRGRGGAVDGRFAREPGFGLTRGDERAGVLHHLRQTQSGVAGGRHGQPPVADGVERVQRRADVLGEATRGRFGDEREKFADTAEATGRFLRGARDERVPDEARVAGAQHVPDAPFLALVALDVGERRQADDRRVR
jgi:hypothetical protein